MSVDPEMRPLRPPPGPPPSARDLWQLYQQLAEQVERQDEHIRNLQARVANLQDRLRPPGCGQVVHLAGEAGATKSTRSTAAGAKPASLVWQEGSGSWDNATKALESD